MDNRKRLIDANELLAKVAASKNNNTHINGRLRMNHMCEQDRFMRMINDTSTVDTVEVVHGRWIHCQGKSNLWYCSECGEKILYNPIRRTYNIEKRPVHEVNKYCRGCGAKMDGGHEDD